MLSAATNQIEPTLPDPPPGIVPGAPPSAAPDAQVDVPGFLVEAATKALNPDAPAELARIAAGEPLARQLLLSGVPVSEVDAVMRRFDARGSRRRLLPALVRRIDAEIGRFHGRDIEAGVRFLTLAGTRVWIRGEADVESWYLLCAYGTTHAGDQRIIDFRLVPNENVSSWAVFLAMLDRRGLHGRDIELVTADVGSPVRTALDVVWPDIRIQQCWSGTLLHLRLMQREYGPTTCVNELADVMCARTTTAALNVLARWARAWRQEAPAVVEYVRRNAEELVAFFDYPARMREDIQSIEPVRRLLLGVRARANPMVTFDNPASCERVVYGIALSSDDDGDVLAMELEAQEPVVARDATSPASPALRVGGHPYQVGSDVTAADDLAHIHLVRPGLRASSRSRRSRIAVDGVSRAPPVDANRAEKRRPGRRSRPGLSHAA